MIRPLLLWVSRNQTLKRELPRYRFFRRAVSRFMPGEKLEDALGEAEGFKKTGAATVFTLLGENVTEKAEAEEVTRHYGRLLAEIRGRDLGAEISLKLTQLGLDLSPEMALENLERVVQRARQLNGGVVWIDMESSKYVEMTLDLFRRIRKKYDPVGLCLQACLYRTAADLQSLLSFTSTIRLVKGAYAEPRSVAFRRKAEVDGNFFRLAVKLLESGPRSDGGRPALATHDEKLMRRLQNTAQERGIEKSGYEFQMLYGIRTGLQQRLLQDHYRLRVLISYGSEWFPWYVRRLAERPANLWFVLKNLLRT